MNAGITEEAGSTARTLISSLTSVPAVLAILVFNILYIGLTTYLQIKQSDRFTENQHIWQQMTEKAMSVCLEQHK
jgi:hypothetical protein